MDIVYITPKEASKLLRVHQNHIYKLCNEGEMPGAKKLGGSWRINIIELQNYFSVGNKTIERVEEILNEKH